MIGLQQGLPSILDLLTCGHAVIGRMGEEWLAQKLQARGYLVSIVHTDGDLKVTTRDGEIFYIEVKTARPATDGNYRFTLYKQSKTGRVKADHRTADLVALLCVTRSGSIVPFIVPVTALITNTCAAITRNPRTYAGKFSQFRQQPSKLSIH